MIFCAVFLLGNSKSKLMVELIEGNSLEVSMM